MTSHRQLSLLARTALLLCFAVVVLGAYVRLSAAGLGCPDWPGCYGHVTPIGAAANATESAAHFGGQEVELAKAWKEMIHRYAAGTLGVLIAVIAALAIQSRRQRILSPGLAVGLLLLVVAQGIFGMLTVTWRLKPLIVTGHLLFGLATLSLLCWVVLALKRSSQHITFGGGMRSRGTGSRWALVALLALIAQISLGGWTSSNYAATACPDLPTCQGAWLPDADYGEGFVLWRGLGISYEGGVLEHQARVAIHFAHRFGAVIVTLLLLWVAHRGLRGTRTAAVRHASIGVLLALGLQLLIAFSMILRGFPLWLATAHNAGAALLLLATVALLHASRVEAGRGH
jgi:cytochrome c oxidase assembly protein subunit 15